MNKYALLICFISCAFDSQADSFIQADPFWMSERATSVLVGRCTEISILTNTEYTVSNVVWGAMATHYALFDRITVLKGSFPLSQYNFTYQQATINLDVVDTVTVMIDIEALSSFSDSMEYLINHPSMSHPYNLLSNQAYLIFLQTNALGNVEPLYGMRSFWPLAEQGRIKPVLIDTNNISENEKNEVEHAPPAGRGEAPRP
jgi:hypothetical protein